jgi:DNA modification methylase
MVRVFRDARRVLRDDGTVWLNLGDSYCNTDKWGGGGNVGKNTVADDGSVPSWAVRRRRPSMPDLKPKDLIGIPWRVALALQADGWYLRQDIIWHKPNPMPESVTDRCTKAHEYIFLLSKSERYHFDAAAIKERATGKAPGNLSHKGKIAYEGGDEFQRTKAGLTNIRCCGIQETAAPSGQ